MHLTNLKSNKMENSERGFSFCQKAVWLRNRAEKGKKKRLYLVYNRIMAQLYLNVQ
jgi:hypothetical protein